MAKIEINDLSRNMTVSRKEMEHVLGGTGSPVPPVPAFGVSVSPQRVGLAMVGGGLSGPISSVDPIPDPPF